MKTPLGIVAALASGIVGCGSACPAGSFRADDGLCTLSAVGEQGAAGATDDTSEEEEDDDATTDPAFGSHDAADDGDGDGDGTVDDLPFDNGDPIITLGRTAYVEKVKWMDATAIDDQYGLLVGDAGWEVVDMAAAEVVASVESDGGLRVATDGSTAAMTGPWGVVLRLDLSDPLDPVPMSRIFRPSEATAEDVAVDGDLLLVGWGVDGAILFGPNGGQRGSIPGNEVLGVGLVGDRAVVADGEELAMYDVSDPADPIELDRVLLQGFGLDVDFDGHRVVVAQGGAGVEVFTVREDALVFDGFLDVPGSSSGVELDGDRVWIAAWDRVALGWLGDGGPVILGHEPVQETAFGIGGRNGRALVSDWQGWVTMEAVPDVAGPELTVPDALWLQGPGEPVVLPVRNHGPFPLTVEVEAQAGVTVDPSTLTINPGARANVIVTPSVGMDHDVTLTLRSNDPDEATTFVPLRVPVADLSTMHPPMNLQSFQLPERGLQPWSLEAQRGKVVLLAYWSLF